MGISIGVGPLTALLFSLLVVTLLTGVPLAVALGGTSVVVGLLFWGPSSLFMFPAKALGAMESIILVAIALFVLMGCILERSGIADALYEAVYLWLGRLKGGLAIGTVGICTIFAAMAGMSAPATVTMGLVALPSMFKRGYSNTIAIGSIAAGGALGILIPPSITMIVYGMMTGVSVGKLFIGGVFPGLLLAGLFMAYIAVRCAINPSMGPPIPVERDVSLRVRFAALRSVVLPLALIVAILGSIYSGIATPTEAAAIGAFGSIICAALYRTLNLKNLREASLEALKLTTMVMWIVIGGYWFASVFQAIGGSQFAQQLIFSLPFGRWGVLILMQVTFIFLGMLMDPLGIIFVTMPVYFPIIMELGFDPVWFGVLFIVNMEMAYLTPPFGCNLFYLKAITPKSVLMMDIYRSCVPFVAIQSIVLIIVMIFPQIILWLPGQMLGGG